MDAIYEELHGTRHGQVRCSRCGQWHIEEIVTPQHVVTFHSEYTLHWYCPACGALMMIRSVMVDGRVLERTRKSVVIREARK